MKIDEKIMENLRNTLPLMFRRTDIGKLTGGIIKPQQLIFISQKYPEIAPHARRFGKFVVYDKDEFMQWVEMYYGNFEERVYDNKSGGFSKKICRGQSAEGGTGQASQGSEGDRGEPEGIFDF
ncbi:MAG: hypothetical protein HDQ88_09410 [Clostridia bacterium]|nr:hypothetical protein [Clostridia bacterium]